MGGAVSAGELKDSLPTLGTAIGLALQGAGETVNKVNLLPQTAKASKEIKKKQPFIIGAVAALYVLVLLLWLKQNAEIDKLSSSVKEADITLNRVRDQNERFEKAKVIDHIKSQLDPLAALALERDLALKVMDEINPNIPNNGDPAKSDDKEKLWVVDWKVEERENKPAEAGNERSANASASYPTKKLLTTVLEVCIQKRATDVEGRGFIVKTLLNYNEAAKRPLDGNKRCAIAPANKAWDLGDSQGVWRVELDHAPTQSLPWPVPKSYVGEPPDEPVGVKDADKREFWRYRVTIEMPVGDESRKALSLAAKKPAEPKPEVPKKD